MNSLQHTNEDVEKHSASVFRQIANTCLPLSVTMVEDTPSNHESGFLPISDTQMAVRDGRFIFKHYTKPMASLEVTLNMSAMSNSAKLNILTNEGTRRLRNCSIDIPWTEQIQYINRLMISMKWGGYSIHQREIVARRILAKYHNNISNYRDTGRPLYRSKEERASILKEDKTSWFRKTGATATFTIPYTPGSQLAKLVRNAIKGSGPVGTQVLVLEKPGNRVMAEIGKNNPFPRKNCGRDNCPLEVCNEKCYNQGIVYEATCVRCIDIDVNIGSSSNRYLYIGETSRTIYTRYQQHISDYMKASRTTNSRSEDDCSSWMWDHSSLVHGGVRDYYNDYKFKPLSSHRDPLSRQITEAVRISKAINSGVHMNDRYEEIPVLSLNRKGECFAPLERWTDTRPN